MRFLSSRVSFAEIEIGPYTRRTCQISLVSGSSNDDLAADRGVLARPETVRIAGITHSPDDRYTFTAENSRPKPYIDTERRYCGRSRGCTSVSEFEFVEIERMRSALTRERLDRGCRSREHLDLVRVGGVRPGFAVGPTFKGTGECLRFRRRSERPIRRPSLDDLRGSILARR